MTPNELVFWVNIAQIASTILTGIGIIVTFAIGIYTLREVRRDRLLRMRPILLFPSGGRQIACKRLSTSELIVPGIEPESLREYLGEFPENAKLNHPEHGFTLRGLKNLGNGHAFFSHVEFQVHEVENNNATRAIVGEERKKFPHMSKANDFPVVPEHIEPGKEGSLTRLPAALVIDYALNIERLKGILVITFKDEAGLLYERKQELTIWKQVDDATDVKYIMTVGGEIVAEKSGIISMFKKKFWRRR